MMRSPYRLLPALVTGAPLMTVAAVTHSPPPTRPAIQAEPLAARGHVWAVVEERDLIPEGTAWEPATRSVLIGSLNKRTVVAIAEDGTVRDRVTRADHGLASVAGIHVDSVRGILWVTSNARYDDDQDTTTSALYGFDAANGAFRSRHDAPAGSSNFFNDLTSAPDGTVYMTDSRAGTVLVLRPGAIDLEPLAGVPTLEFANGITISDDGAHLFIAAGDGIHVFVPGTGDTRVLTEPEGITIPGIDGLAFTEDGLIAHHPSSRRIARYALDPAHRAVIGRTVYESGAPDIRTSTTGEIVGGEYVYIGNGQLVRMNDGTIDATTMDPVRMYRVALEPESGRVAVALSARDSVALFDAHTLDRVATLAVGRTPHEIAASPDGTVALVADAADSTITLVHRSAEVAATWRLQDGLSVHDVAMTADGTTVWAVSGEPAIAVRLDARSGAQLNRYALERTGSWMVEADGPGGAAVIAHLEGGAVTVLHPDGEQIVIAADEGEIDASPGPDTATIWSVNLPAGTLTVRRASDGEILHRVQVGQDAGRVRFTPDGRTALVLSAADSSIIAFDVVGFRRSGSVTVPAGPKVLAVSPDGRRAYVTHPDRGALTMIDVPSLTVLRTIDVAGVPDGVAVLEARRTVGGGD